MLALAARFSKSPFFDRCPAFDKGVPFGKRAADIYYYTLRAPPKSGLEHLQGCILFGVLPLPLRTKHGRLVSHRYMYATGV